MCEDGDDDSQLLYSESLKRAGVGSPRAHRANDGAPQGASVQALDAKDPDETEDEETQDERATPEKETAACPVLVALPQENMEADTPPGQHEEDKDGSPPSSPILMPNRASVSLSSMPARAGHACPSPEIAPPPPLPPPFLHPSPPSSLQATALCDEEPERDDPEQGPKAPHTETGEKSVVGRKKGRPARGDEQALPQETQETLPLK
jgi:hypothetical protein